ncbi:phosphopyruvate hydratase [soil metagenome]
MSKIKDIKAREIFDSRGNPTVEVDVVLASGASGRMMVPSGASTGMSEALELRDGGSRYRGKGVRKAVQHVNQEIRSALIGQEAEDQENLDRLMIALDGSAEKANLGANAILGVSFASAHAAASEARMPLFRYLAQKYLGAGTPLSIPVPMVNIISGGLHAGKNMDLQDFLIIPVSAPSYPEALEMISNVYWKTKEVLLKKGYNAHLLADEGGFGPALSSNEEALETLSEVFHLCGYQGWKEVAIALDVAASHFYDERQKRYHLHSENRSLDAAAMIDLLEKWTRAYPVISIEDGLAENDWEGWQVLTERLGQQVQLVGDDLFTTNPLRLQKGFDLRAGNAVLVKMNQIGTLTETVQAVRMAKAAGYRTVISARSGETEDATLADLAVGLNGGQVKIGSVAGSSRLSKYNQLLRIDEEIGGRYGGSGALQVGHL